MSGTIYSFLRGSRSMLDLPAGLRLVPGFLDTKSQAALASALEEVLASAPFYRPRMPRSGKPLSVRMTNCGPLGWVSDEAGYRYEALHPETRRPWPPMPAPVLAAWGALSDYPHPPEACLVNYYGPGAKMGLHQDRDEHDLDAPVVSLSLGDTCLFRVGGKSRRAPTAVVRLASGMHSCSAEMHASPSMVSTGSFQAVRRCSRREDASISRSAALRARTGSIEQISARLCATITV
jgi:alkylated DNA repair protein (DNA oxidative demethylase)